MISFEHFLSKEMYFDYQKNVISKDFFPILYEEVKNKVKINAKGRSSCVYNLHPLNLFPYSHLPIYKSEEVPKILSKIRTTVEKKTGEIFDYVLVHVYDSGLGSIAYHSDKEAMNSVIVSISLGATRKFRLREKNRKSGFDYEFSLESGDMFIMLTGCQQKYFHSVPVESRVKEARISLTFRQYEF